MLDVLAALVPTVTVTVVFVAIIVTILRSQHGGGRRR
jgi:hypothetical protein